MYISSLSFDLALFLLFDQLPMEQFSECRATYSSQPTPRACYGAAGEHMLDSCVQTARFIHFLLSHHSLQSYLYSRVYFSTMACSRAQSASKCRRGVRSVTIAVLAYSDSETRQQCKQLSRETGQLIIDAEDPRIILRNVVGCRVGFP